MLMQGGHVWHRHSCLCFDKMQRLTLLTRAHRSHTMASMSHTHATNLATGGASSPKQRDEHTRFDPIAFENDRAVRPHIEHHDRVQTLNVDAEILASELKRAIRGEVRFDDGSRALYATDASNYRQVPIGVVMPRDPDDVVATVALARKHGAPILARGGGTSLAGQCCNVAVVLDFSKYMHEIVELNVDDKFAIIEPGIILDDL